MTESEVRKLLRQMKELDISIKTVDAQLQKSVNRLKEMISHAEID